MSEYTHTLEVDRPLRDVYDQWTQMEEFPRFMDGVQQVDQVSATRTHWRVSVAGVEREFDAEITEQEPDRLMTWTSLEPPHQSGTVRFQPAGPDSTQVSLTMHFDPEGLAENVGDFLGLVEDRVVGDLTRFKNFIEDEKLPTGAWRGTVEGGEPQEPAHRQNPPGYSDLGGGPGTRTDTSSSDAVTDPGSPPQEAGVPVVEDDLGRSDEPEEPMRRSVPTDVPVASLDFGTTAQETAAGESHERRIERENPPQEP